MAYRGFESHPLRDRRRKRGICPRFRLFHAFPEWRPRVRKFRRSNHLSFFRKGTEVFLHHDLTGDIVGMDEKLVAFLDWFATPRSEPETRAHWKADFSKDDLDAFYEILPDHCALILEELDEVRELDDWYPLR